MIEAEVKSLALREGAIRAGIARHEAFGDAPPSADMGYVTPWPGQSFPLPYRWAQTGSGLFR